MSAANEVEGSPMELRERRAVVVTGVLFSIAVFVVYAVMAARDVMFGDAVELVASAIQNGVAHPPGYPLWIILGHLASLVPFGPIAYRVNLTACAFHAVAVGLVYASGYVLVRRHGPALFAGALLAIASPLFLNWSLQAEVFSLNDLFAASIVLLCLLWLDDARRWTLVVPIALLFGLGLANQQTLILLAPLPLWTIWCARGTLRTVPRLPILLGTGAALLVLGFWIPYLHIILATPHLPRYEFGQAQTFSELLDVIMRRAFGSFNLVAQSNEQGGSPVDRIALLVRNGGWPYLAASAGLVGLVYRKQYRQLVIAGLIILCPLVAFCVVANFNLDTEIARGIFSRFGLLPLVAIAPFSACATFLLDAVTGNRRVQAIAGSSIAVIALAIAAVFLPRFSLADDHGTRNLARDIFAALPPHAILLTASAAVEVVPTYYQQIEGWRPDVTEASYAYMTMPPYQTWISQYINVPPGVSGALAPNEMRDLLVHANPSRPFYVVGDRPIHAPGPLSQPLVEGVVSRMIPLNVHINERDHYTTESALQSRSGYGDVSADFWKSNGFAGEVRPFYAGGFFTTGMDAKRLGNLIATRYWLERASNYSPDPLIAQELAQLEVRQ